MEETKLCPPEFSINIYNAAYYELEFVKQIQDNQILKEPEVIKISLYRYEKLWLPFLHNFSKDSQNDLEVLPPLDVHWIWHTHMLSPIQYESDCRQHGYRKFNHQLIPLVKMEEKRKFTKAFWMKIYPNEPFDLPALKTDIIAAYKNVELTSTLKYDLVNAVLCIKSSYYKVPFEQTFLVTFKNTFVNFNHVFCLKKFFFGKQLQKSNCEIACSSQSLCF
jgi:hypothetical protein